LCTWQLITQFKCWKTISTNQLLLESLTKGCSDHKALEGAHGDTPQCSDYDASKKPISKISDASESASDGHASRRAPSGRQAPTAGGHRSFDWALSKGLAGVVRHAMH
jgi:hypothetical protein